MHGACAPDALTSARDAPFEPVNGSLKGKANLRSQAYICEGSLILIGGTFVPEKKRTFVRKQGR